MSKQARRRSPSSSTLTPAPSIFRCSAPSEPRCGMLTARVFCRRRSVARNLVRSSPRRSAATGSRRTRWSAAAPSRTAPLSSRGSGSRRRCRADGARACPSARPPGALRGRTAARTHGGCGAPSRLKAAGRSLKALMPQRPSRAVRRSARRRRCAGRRTRNAVKIGFDPRREFEDLCGDFLAQRGQPILHMRRNDLVGATVDEAVGF